MTTPYSKSAIALIEAAEQLIASRGLDVPLREIGQAAGSANKVAVQYHFGDRQRLIESIFQYRLPQLEVRRASLMASQEPEEPSRLLEALLRPIAEVTDADGKRSFAGFLFQLTAHAREARADFDDLAPFATFLVAQLRRTLPSLPDRLFERRLGTASLAFLDCLVRMEREKDVVDGSVEEALALAIAIMTAPTPAP